MTPDTTELTLDTVNRDLLYACQGNGVLYRPHPGHRKYKDKTSPRTDRDTWTGADQRDMDRGR